MKSAFFLGRMIFGGFFLYNGIHHLTAHKNMAQYVGGKHIPAPDAAVKATGAALIVGGASILLGVKPKLGAAVIAGFLAGVSPLMHNYWVQEDPARRQAEQINFGKNMALLGATLALTAVPEPWPASVPVGQPSRMQRLRSVVERFAA